MIQYDTLVYYVIDSRYCWHIISVIVCMSISCIIGIRIEWYGAVWCMGHRICISILWHIICWRCCVIECGCRDSVWCIWCVGVVVSVVIGIRLFLTTFNTESKYCHRNTNYNQWDDRRDQRHRQHRVFDVTCMTDAVQRDRQARRDGAGNDGCFQTWEHRSRGMDHLAGVLDGIENGSKAHDGAERGYAGKSRVKHGQFTGWGTQRGYKGIWRSCEGWRWWLHGWGTDPFLVGQQRTICGRFAVVSTKPNDTTVCMYPS